jgi:hypothetical protein
MNVYDAKVFDPKKTERVYLATEADAAIAELVEGLKTSREYAVELLAEHDAKYGRNYPHAEVMRAVVQNDVDNLGALIAKWERV